MHRVGRWFLFGWVWLLAHTAQANLLVIAGDPWCPLNCEPNTERPGIVVELAQSIFAEAGIVVQYQTSNWARVLREVRAGEFGAAIGAAIEDAPDFVFTRDPLTLSRSCFYTREDSRWYYHSVNSLPSIRIGVVNDYRYGEPLDSYILANTSGQQVQVAAGNKALQRNLNKLEQYRLDAVFENSLVMQQSLQHHGLRDKVREAGCRQDNLPIYLAFSPAHPESPRYAELFADGLERYRQDGRLEQVLARYGVTGDSF